MLYSAALIVKNEERVLARCLGSLHGVVDEIVVVDTGSEDGTRRIAETFTSSVYSFTWNDDFAAARNFAVERASGTYILSIDADEYLVEPEKARDRLDAFVCRHGPDTVGTVDILSPTQMGATAAQSVFAAQRFFKRELFRFEGAIHEQIVPVSGQKCATRTGLRFMHTGYAQDPASEAHKSHRNKRMLAVELAKHPDDEYYLYQLGRAHFALAEYAEAVRAFERAWQTIRFEPGQPPMGRLGPVAPAILTDLVVILAYAYANAGRLDAALDHLKACEHHEHEAMAALFKASPDFHYVCGYVYLMQGDVARSRAAYDEALHAGPEREQVLGTGSFSSLYHLGLLSEADGNVDQAVEFYCRALAVNPLYEPAMERTIDLIIEKHRRPHRTLCSAADRGTFAQTYRRRFERCLREGDSRGAALLLEGAQSLSSDLYALCLAAMGKRDDI